MTAAAGAAFGGVIGAWYSAKEFCEAPQNRNYKCEELLGTMTGGGIVGALGGVVVVKTMVQPGLLLKKCISQGGCGAWDYLSISPLAISIVGLLGAWVVKVVVDAQINAIMGACSMHAAAGSLALSSSSTSARSNSNSSSPFPNGLVSRSTRGTPTED